MEKEKVSEKQKEIAQESGRLPFYEYQNAITAILEELPRSERKEYAKLAEEWNEEGCPPHVQRHNYKKTGLKFLQTVSRVAWQQYGARLVICATVKDVDGVQVITL